MKRIQIGKKTFKVDLATVDDQWEILQAVLKYGIGPFLRAIMAAKGDVKQFDAAVISAVSAIVVSMPYDEQNALLERALSKTVQDGEDRIPASKSLFNGKMPDYLMLGVRAVEYQLGDFSSFLSLMPKSTEAKAQE